MACKNSRHLLLGNLFTQRDLLQSYQPKKIKLWCTNTVFECWHTESSVSFFVHCENLRDLIVATCCHFHGCRGIENLHNDFHKLYFVGLSKSSIVKKIAEFGFVVDGVASSLKFLVVIQRLQEARPLPIGNIIIFSKRILRKTNIILASMCIPIFATDVSFDGVSLVVKNKDDRF